MDWGFFKHHPWITGGIALFGLILFFMLNRGGSSATTSTSSGPSPQQVAAAAQVQMAQLSSNTAVHVADTQAKNQIDLATILAGVEGAKVAATQTVDLAQLQDSLQLGLAQLSGQSHVAELQAGLASQQLANEHAATQKDYLLQYHAQNVQDDIAAWNYTLQYQQNANNATTNNALIDLLKSKAA